MLWTPAVLVFSGLTRQNELSSLRPNSLCFLCMSLSHWRCAFVIGFLLHWFIHKRTTHRSLKIKNHPTGHLSFILISTSLNRDPAYTALWARVTKNTDWSTRPLGCLFARCIAHSLACSGLPASLAPSAALTRSLARSLRSLPRSWKSEFLMSQNDLVLSHSAMTTGRLPMTTGRLLMTIGRVPMTTKPNRDLSSGVGGRRRE